MSEGSAGWQGGQDRSSGEHWDGMHSISQVGVTEMVPAKPARWKESVKKGAAPASASTPPEKFPADPYPLAPSLKLTGGSSHMTQMLFKLSPLSWDLKQVSLCVSPSRARVSVSPSPSALPDVSPTGFQSQALAGSYSCGRFPALGSPVCCSKPSLLRVDLHSCDGIPILGLPH